MIFAGKLSLMASEIKGFLPVPEEKVVELKYFFYNCVIIKNPG